MRETDLMFTRRLQRELARDLQRTATVPAWDDCPHGNEPDCPRCAEHAARYTVLLRAAWGGFREL